MACNPLLLEGPPFDLAPHISASSRGRIVERSSAGRPCFAAASGSIPRRAGAPNQAEPRPASRPDQIAPLKSESRFKGFITRRARSPHAGCGRRKKTDAAAALQPDPTKGTAQRSHRLKPRAPDLLDPFPVAFGLAGIEEMFVTAGPGFHRPRMLDRTPGWIRAHRDFRDTREDPMAAILAGQYCDDVETGEAASGKSKK